MCAAGCVPDTYPSRPAAPLGWSWDGVEWGVHPNQLWQHLKCPPNSCPRPSGSSAFAQSTPRASRLGRSWALRREREGTAHRQRHLCQPAIGLQVPPSRATPIPVPMAVMGGCGLGSQLLPKTWRERAWAHVSPGGLSIRLPFLPTGPGAPGKHTTPHPLRSTHQVCLHVLHPPPLPLSIRPQAQER